MMAARVGERLGCEYNPNNSSAIATYVSGLVVSSQLLFLQVEDRSGT